jgi:hypothetical protein
MATQHRAEPAGHRSFQAGPRAAIPAVQERAYRLGKDLDEEKAKAVEVDKQVRNTDTTCM